LCLARLASKILAQSTTVTLKNIIYHAKFEKSFVKSYVRAYAAAGFPMADDPVSGSNRPVEELGYLHFE
jgi:hypothetical protein